MGLQLCVRRRECIKQHGALVVIDGVRLKFAG